MRAVCDMWNADSYNNLYSHSDSNLTIKYMEIPLDQDIFELPLFAFWPFVNAIKCMDTQIPAIAVCLNTIGSAPNYKTVDRNMQDVLVSPFKSSRLAVLNVKQGEQNLTYYGTAGAVFDKDLRPLMVCSYQLERIKDTIMDTVTRYKFLQLIMRVHPDVFLYKKTSMERFIVNKLMPICLENSFDFPHLRQHDQTFIRPLDYDRHSVKVKVEICESPYLIHDVDTPSISTSNQQLLQLAIDHLDELIQ